MKYRKFSEEPKPDVIGDNFMQVYGKGSVYGEYRRPEKSKPKPIKLNLHLEFPKKIGVEHIGYILMALILIIQIIVFFVVGNWKDAIGGFLLLGLSLFIPLAIKFNNYSENLNYYLANTTVTLKALYCNLGILKFLMQYSKKLLYMCIFTIVINQYILSLILPLFVTNIIHYISFYEMILLGMLCFANRETSDIQLGFTIFSFYELLETIGKGLFGSYKCLDYNSTITMLVFWTVACLFEHCVIKDIPLSEEQRVQQDSIFDVDDAR